MEEVLKDFPDNYFDSIVTDPPYGLKFMGKKWDYEVPIVNQWEEAIRVLKPGGHLLCACGTRTQHRMAVNIEDAGFEIRDIISWIYGSGFPKSLNVSKAVDSHLGETRNTEKKLVGDINNRRYAGKEVSPRVEREVICNTPISEEAAQWNGWGTALKPATELWTLARKPLSEGTVAENFLKHGTGGINIDGCRIEGEVNTSEQYLYIGDNGNSMSSASERLRKNGGGATDPQGRFPSNLILDEFASVLLDRQSGNLKSGAGTVTRRADNKVFASGNKTEFEGYGDYGGASRFFYCAKADRSERNKGLKDFEIKPLLWSSGTQNPGSFQSEGTNKSSQNFHPTVKPINLMRYLVKLITPKGGVILDPFCGSGTTLIAAKLEFMNYVGIDISEDYCKISEARIVAWNPEKYSKQSLFET